ncbi:MAG: hypothetical protein AAF503_07175 [Pseudomonadota bacterium]
MNGELRIAPQFERKTPQHAGFFLFAAKEIPLQFDRPHTSSGLSWRLDLILWQIQGSLIFGAVQSEVHNSTRCSTFQPHPAMAWVHVMKDTAMTIYSVSYDLNKPGTKYTELYERIKSFGSWAHALDSTWFVSSSKSAAEVQSYLKPAIDKNDHLFVSEINQNHSGWLPAEICEWLRKQMQYNH